MFSGTDAVESFFNSIEVVKGSLTPLELQIQRIARDLEYCWLGSNSGRYNIADFGRWTRIDSSDNKVQICSLKKSNVRHDVCKEKKKGFSIRLPINAVMGLFAQNPGSDFHKTEMLKREDRKKGFGSEDGSCVNCFQFAVTWSLLLSNFIQAIPSPFKIVKRPIQKLSNGDNGSAHSCTWASKSKITNDLKKKESVVQSVLRFSNDVVSNKEENNMSLEGLVGFIFDQFTQNLQKFDHGDQNTHQNSRDTSPLSTPKFDHAKAATSILEGTKNDLNGFLGNLCLAKVGGMPSSIIGKDPPVQDGDIGDTTGHREESGGGSAQKKASGLLSIPLANVERLKSSLSTFSLAELIELVPLLGKPPNDYPDKKKLLYVQDFYRYTEVEGRKFFEELDRDGDGHVTLEDLKIALGRRKLPKRYAREFMRRTKSHLFSKSFGWKQFLSLMEQKESTILQAYTNLCLSKSGTLQKSEIMETLKNAGLPANEDNAVAMIRFLNADTEEPISYGHFRNFMLLVPSDRIQDDPRSIWFEAATVVVVEPPVELPTGSVLKSALAGGLACALSTSLMYPIDSIKTRVQASALSFPEIISKVPEIGVQGLYKGSIPAILGQFSSHGLRTGIFEASKLVLIKIAPTIPEIQVQSLASFCSTFLGTAVRIPCEVMKQRLQAGIFENVGDAIVGTWRQDGLKGFFRGTCATLCREVPFYVAGMGLYAESKKAAERVLQRELEAWETIGVGALSGGVAAVVTTPFDVMKTRMMTAQRGRGMSMTMVAFWVVRHHGLVGLFKGALPRFFWIAPLGAMNFAGYELAKKAMNKNEDITAAS